MRSGAVQISGPIQVVGKNMSAPQALEKGRSVRKARKAKETKCIPICNIARFEFHALILESTGCIDKKFIDVLKRAIEKKKMRMLLC